MAEETGWAAWRKENKTFHAGLMLCVCVTAQVGCFVILGMIVQSRKAELTPADVETGKPKKIDETPTESVQQGPITVKEAVAAQMAPDLTPDAAVQDQAAEVIECEDPKSLAPATEEEASPSDNQASAGADEAPPADVQAFPGVASETVAMTLSTPIALDEIVRNQVGPAPEAAPRKWWQCFQEPCCNQQGVDASEVAVPRPQSVPVLGTQI